MTGLLDEISKSLGISPTRQSMREQDYTMTIFLRMRVSRDGGDAAKVLLASEGKYCRIVSAPIG